MSQIKAPFQYLFNKPVTASVEKITDGAIARKEFAEFYGAYFEIMYVLCKGDFTKMESIGKWKTEKALLIGEYLIRKRDVENIK